VAGLEQVALENNPIDADLQEFTRANGVLFSPPRLTVGNGSARIRTGADGGRRLVIEIQTMGKVVVRARIENLADRHRADAGDLPAGQVRTLEVRDALVDTGATYLSMPKRLIEQLGLRFHRNRTARTATGMATFAVYGAVRLTVDERDCVVEVSELPDTCPVLIGQLPLEALDFVVDPIGQRLIGNPDHGGKDMMDMF